MGWTPLDTAIERTRDKVTEDPAGAQRVIGDLLEETRNPSGRVRLWGLMILACRRVGDLRTALKAYQSGSKVRRASTFARAELEVHAALMYTVRGDLDSACTTVAKAICLIRPLAENPRGESKGARRLARRDRALYATALIIRAEIARNLEGDPVSLRRALADALEALRWVDPRHESRVHLSGVTAVSVLVTKVGTRKDITDVLQLAIEGERLLRRRRIPARHPHRLKLKAIRALALARLGSVEQAERILAGVVSDLRELGLDDDADRAAVELLWVVGDRAGQVGRARYLRRSLGLPAAAEPAEPEPDDSAPIGF